MARCEIIVIRYGLPELEQECIDSVIAHTSDVEYILTVHDNYEADEGLSKVWNELIHDSDAEYICLLNNDTRVEPKWLSKMLECFEEDSKLGALGPMTNSSTGPQGNRKYRTTTKRLMRARYPLVAFCLIFPRKVWEEVGGFDEGYEIYGEDSDFIMEVKERRYTAAIRTDVFIFHHGKSSTPIAIARGKDILRMKKESKERFIKKWKSGPLTEVQKEELAEKTEELRAEGERRAQAMRAARLEAKIEAAKVRRETELGRKLQANEVEAIANSLAAPNRGSSVFASKKRLCNNQGTQAKLDEKQKRRKRFLEWKKQQK